MTQDDERVIGHREGVPITAQAGAMRDMLQRAIHYGRQRQGLDQAAKRVTTAMEAYTDALTEHLRLGHPDAGEIDRLATAMMAEFWRFVGEAFLVHEDSHPDFPASCAGVR